MFWHRKPARSTLSTARLCTKSSRRVVVINQDGHREAIFPFEKQFLRPVHFESLFPHVRTSTIADRNVTRPRKDREETGQKECPVDAVSSFRFLIRHTGSHRPLPQQATCLRARQLSATIYVGPHLHRTISRDPPHMGVKLKLIQQESYRGQARRAGRRFDVRAHKAEIGKRFRESRGAEVHMRIASANRPYPLASTAFDTPENPSSWLSRMSVDAMAISIASTASALFPSIDGL